MIKKKKEQENLCSQLAIFPGPQPFMKPLYKKHSNHTSGIHKNWKFYTLFNASAWAPGNGTNSTLWTTPAQQRSDLYMYILITRMTYRIYPHTLSNKPLLVAKA